MRDINSLITSKIESYKELPTGTPKGILHFAQATEAHKSSEISFSETLSKRMVSSQKPIEKHPIHINRSFSARNIQLMVSTQKPSQGRHSAGSYGKAAIMELLLTTTNLPSDHRVLHIHGYAIETCIIHFKEQNRF